MHSYLISSILSISCTFLNLNGTSILPKSRLEQGLIILSQFLFRVCFFDLHDHENTCLTLTANLQRPRSAVHIFNNVHKTDIILKYQCHTLLTGILYSRRKNLCFNEAIHIYLCSLPGAMQSTS